MIVHWRGLASSVELQFANDLLPHFNEAIAA